MHHPQCRPGRPWYAPQPPNTYHRDTRYKLYRLLLSPRTFRRYRRTLGKPCTGCHQQGSSKTRRNTPIPCSGRLYRTARKLNRTQVRCTNSGSPRWWHNLCNPTLHPHHRFYRCCGSPHMRMWSQWCHSTCDRNPGLHKVRSHSAHRCRHNRGTCPRRGIDSMLDPHMSGNQSQPRCKVPWKRRHCCTHTQRGQSPCMLGSYYILR